MFTQEKKGRKKIWWSGSGKFLLVNLGITLHGEMAKQEIFCFHGRRYIKLPLSDWKHNANIEDRYSELWPKGFFWQDKFLDLFSLVCVQNSRIYICKKKFRNFRLFWYFFEKKGSMLMTNCVSNTISLQNHWHIIMRQKSGRFKKCWVGFYHRVWYRFLSHVLLAYCGRSETWKRVDGWDTKSIRSMTEISGHFQKKLNFPFNSYSETQKSYSHTESSLFELNL